jgi:cobaltochelatase CobT
VARRNRQIQIFESSIEKLGRILSQKYRIRVVFQHDRCETEGSTIYLPVVPDNATQDLLDAMQGHLDNQVAHLVFTDFDVLKKIKKEKKLYTVTNALESPRVERKFADLWRGASVNLKNSLEWTLKKLSETRTLPDGTKRKPYDALSDFGKVIYAATVFSQVEFNTFHWFFKDVVERDVLAKVRQVEDILRSSKAAGSTTDVIEFAREMMKLLNEAEEPEEAPPEPKPGDIILPKGTLPKPSPQDEVMLKKPKRDPNDPTIFQLDDAEDEEEEQQQQQESGQGPGGGGQTPGSGGGRGTGSNGSAPLNMDPTDKQLEQDAKLTSRNQMLKDAAKRELTGSDSYLVYTTEGDRYEQIKDGDRIKFKEFMQQAIATVGVVKRKLSRSLLTSAITRWETDKTRGKLNPRALYRLAMGTSKRVFRQKVESEGFDVCVVMMIDHSGSMYDTKLELAAQTAIIFGEICYQLGIPFAVYGFSTGDGHEADDRYDKASPDEQKLYARWGDHWIGVYKEFDDLWPMHNHKLINITKNRRSNTYDGESLRYGAQRLLQRREKRKIMFWLNDGQPCPNSADNDQAHEDYAHQCAKEVEKLVELVAVGITTEAVKRYYKHVIVVNNLKDCSLRAWASWTRCCARAGSRQSRGECFALETLCLSFEGRSPVPGDCRRIDGRRYVSLAHGGVWSRLVEDQELQRGCSA